jgi:hypothetical protein
MVRTRLSDLPSWQRRLIVGAGVVQVSLQVAALFDLRRRPQAQIRGPKRMWAAVSFLNFVGPISYFAIGRRKK